ncbi:MAG: cupin domain-containing protein [Candidatus Omnitrophota bacterium]
METKKEISSCVVRRVEDVEAVPCPCGASVRLLTAQNSPNLGLHVTHIKDSKKHYHKKTTEAYYILEGSGYLEAGNETIAAVPGTCVLIPKGVPHRGWGDFKTIVVCVPPFDPDDEFLISDGDH